MKKFFVISDVHGFYNEMKKSLYKAGYRKSNKNHILIVCGDIFDRGPDSVKIYNFLKSLPRNRRVLIRGNHEMLLKKLVERGYFCKHDYHNGTLGTVCQFTGYTYYDCVEIPGQVLEDFNNLGVLQWIFSEDWVNYWEYKNYIFVHSWIPLIINDDLPMYYTENRNFEFKTDWRESTDSEWESAMWGCPYKLLLQGLYPADKTIVCGHWHARDFHTYVENKAEVDDSIFISDNCIALDACTVLSGECHVYSFDE